MQTLQLESQHTKFHIGHSFMAVGVFMALLLSLFLSAIPTQSAYAFGTNDIAVLSNNARNQNGVFSLVTNSQLANAAQAKANHMVQNGYFEHTAPDGTTGWYFIGQQGYSYTNAGENLAATNESAAAVVDGWMNSPGHRANLLSTNFKDVGYGLAYMGSWQGYSDVYFVVALYANPLHSPPASPANPTPSGPVAGNTPESTSPETPASAEPAPPAAASIEKLDIKTPQPTLISGGNLSGTSSLSKPRFSIGRNLALGVAVVSGTLMLGGLALDIRRLMRHGAGIHHHTLHHTH